MIKYIRLIFTCGWYILIKWPKICKMAKNKEKYPITERYNAVRTLILHVLKHWHIDIHTEGLEQYLNYQGKKLIIMNHLSAIDCLAFIAECEKPIMFIAKKEVEKYPFVGKIVKVIDGLFLDRDNLLNQMRTLNQAMKIAKDENGPDVTIFPEGTRNKIPGSKCLEFKAGTFKIAMKAGIAIFPVAIYGAFRLVPTKYNMKKFPVQISVLNPILPEEFEKHNSFDFASKCQNLIDNEILKMREKDLLYLKDIKMSKKCYSLAIESDLRDFNA